MIAPARRSSESERSARSEPGPGGSRPRGHSKRMDDEAGTAGGTALAIELLRERSSELLAFDLELGEDAGKPALALDRQAQVPDAGVC